MLCVCVCVCVRERERERECVCFSSFKSYDKFIVHSFCKGMKVCMFHGLCKECVSSNFDLSLVSSAKELQIRKDFWIKLIIIHFEKIS